MKRLYLLFTLIILLISNSGNAQTLIVPPQNTTNEGGEVNLQGAGTYNEWKIDNYSGSYRLFTGANTFFNLDNQGRYTLNSLQYNLLKLKRLGASGGLSIQMENGGATGNWSIAVGSQNYFAIHKTTSPFGAQFIIKDNGYVGVGVVEPLSLLHVSSSDNGDAILRLEADADNNNEGDNPRIELFQDGGTSGALIGFNQEMGAGEADSDNFFRIATLYSGVYKNNTFVIRNSNGYVGIGKSPTAALDVLGDGKYSGMLTIGGNTAIGGTGNATLKVRHVNGKSHTSADLGDLYLNYHTNSPVYIGSSANAANLFTYGNVGVGTTNTFGYRLAVNGTIGAKEVKVEVTSPWPDYVFAKSYQLMPLEETKAYIEANQHLPGLPSATEVAEDGIALGEMNAKLLEKIEELTLHLINKDEEVKLLQKQMAEIIEKLNKQ